MMKTIGIQSKNVETYAIVEAGADRNMINDLISRLQMTGAIVHWYGFDCGNNLDKEIDDLSNYYDAVLVAAAAGKKIG